MSSLKEKSKTLNELLWENRLEWDKWLRMGVTEQKQIELAPKYQEKWVRLEDAQKEISRVRKERDEMEELANDVANQYSKKYEELKQKLQQLLNKFPKKRWNEAFEWKDYATNEIDVWKQKFEELLKGGNE